MARFLWTVVLCGLMLVAFSFAVGRASTGIRLGGLVAVPGVLMLATTVTGSKKAQRYSATLKAAIPLRREDLILLERISVKTSQLGRRMWWTVVAPSVLLAPIYYCIFSANLMAGVYVIATVTTGLGCLAIYLGVYERLAREVRMGMLDVRQLKRVADLRAFEYLQLPLMALLLFALARFAAVVLDGLDLLPFQIDVLWALDLATVALRLVVLVTGLLAVTTVLMPLTAGENMAGLLAIPALAGLVLAVATAMALDTVTSSMLVLFVSLACAMGALSPTYRRARIIAVIFGAAGASAICGWVLATLFGLVGVQAQTLFGLFAGVSTGVLLDSLVASWVDRHFQ